jgi:hypothetical protein
VKCLADVDRIDAAVLATVGQAVDGLRLVEVEQARRTERAEGVGLAAGLGVDAAGREACAVLVADPTDPLLDDAGVAVHCARSIQRNRALMRVVGDLRRLAAEQARREREDAGLRVDLAQVGELAADVRRGRAR